MRDRTRLQHVALNVAKLVNARSDRVLAADVANSDVVEHRRHGHRLGRTPARPAGQGARGWGRSPGPAARGVRGRWLQALFSWRDSARSCSSRWRRCRPVIRNSALPVSGTATSSPSQEADVVREIRDSGADCLFIGMPTPRKERFLAAHRDALNVPFIMGVGGAFDVLSGRVQRAPLRMQALGLEWLFRIYQEPRRMWWRYAKTNALFAAILGRELVRHRLRPAVSAPGARQMNSSINSTGARG